MIIKLAYVTTTSTIGCYVFSNMTFNGHFGFPVWKPMVAGIIFGPIIPPIVCSLLTGIYIHSKIFP